MQDFHSSPRTFSVWVALATLVAGGLFAAPPAAAYYRLATAKALVSAVSAISAAKANPGIDQAGGTNSVRHEQAGRQEETSLKPGASLKVPQARPTSPDGDDVSRPDIRLAR